MIVILLRSTPLLGYADDNMMTTWELGTMRSYRSRIPHTLLDPLTPATELTPVREVKRRVML